MALAVFAWWQRRYGLAGLVATALFAVSPFVLVYDRQARMFGLLTLGAVVAAAASDRWLATVETQVGGRGRRRRRSVVAMSYSVGFLLPGFLLLVPGWRRDRQAWIFRLASAGAVGIWAVLWLGNTPEVGGSTVGLPGPDPELGGRHDQRHGRTGPGGRVAGAGPAGGRAGGRRCVSAGGRANWCSAWSWCRCW